LKQSVYKPIGWTLDPKKKQMPPVVPIIGFSGSGKTTLLEKLIQAMAGRGFKVGTIKHHGHDFEMDKPGKDSWRHKQAGASATIIASPSQVGLVMDVDTDQSLDDLVPMLTGMDIILVEGYKRTDREKIEVYRPGISESLLCLEDPKIIALVTRATVSCSVPRFAPDAAANLAEFIIHRFSL